MNNRTGRHRWAAVRIVSIASAIGLGAMVLTPSRVSAQAAYGSYVGIGGSAGLSDGGAGEDSSSGVVISARYKLLEVPLSLRAQLLISDSTAIVPTISYDLPLSWYADVYLGAGVAIQDSETDASPVGNQTSFVLQPGIDYTLPYSDLVLYGNAIIAFDGYRNSNNAAASVQGGIGLRF